MTAPALVSVPAAAAGGNAIAAAALSQLSKPYGWARPLRWKLHDPNAFDCSGLLGWSVYQATGKSLPHQTAAMYAMVLSNQVFTKVPYADAAPGDAVFFGTPVHHCGVVIGGGQMVEAPTFGIPVRISSIADNPASLRPYVGRIATPGGAGGGGIAGLNAEQASNASIIAAVGGQLGATLRDVEVAIMAALDESGLRNLTGGDRDSAGLFQQRPSQGWGSYDQVTNPVYASTKFFNALLALPNRNSEDPWMEAQDVQHSGDPTGSNYQRYWTQAQTITAAQVAGASPTGAYGGTVGSSAAQGFSWWDPFGIAHAAGNAATGIADAIAAIFLKGVFVVGGIVIVILGAKAAAENRGGAR